MLAIKRMAKQEVQVERFAKFGKSSERQYEPPITVNARVVGDDEVVELSDGNTVVTQYVIYVDGGASYLPVWHDRLTFMVRGEEHTAVVVKREEGKSLRSTAVDHVVLFAREE